MLNNRWFRTLAVLLILGMGVTMMLETRPTATANAAANEAGVKPSLTPVSVEEKDGVVTATNGSYTVAYDLATGLGSVAWNGQLAIRDFHSNYKLAGTQARFRSSDPAARTAAWEGIETNGYGSDGVRLTISSALEAGPTIRLSLELYPNRAYFLTDLTVESPDALDIEILEPIAAPFLDIEAGTDRRIFTTPYSNNFDFGVAPVHDFGHSQNGADRFEGEQLRWEPFNGVSHWVAAVFDNAGRQGLVAGAATAVNWKSAQKLGQAAAPNGPLTEFSVYNWGGSQRGTAVASDKFFFGYYADYQAGLEEYGNVYNIGEPRMAWEGDVPIGFNTYYSHYGYASAEAMYPLVDYMAEHLQPLGYEYFNLDGGFTPEAGLPFDDGMKKFADYVHAKGLKVGGYQTPFTIYNEWLDLPIPGTPYTHRDICLRDENGELIRTYLGTYAMDVTHPGAQAALRSAIQKYIDWGFDYLKLDFIDMGMYDGARFDPSMNGMQAYRLGMGIIRETVLAADRPIYINESIAPLLPAAFAHGRRAACDTTIGVDGYSGLERQAFNSAASWWTNGTLYEYNDADMILPENFAQGFWYKFSQKEGKLLGTTVALGGGHWLAGDNFPFLAEDRMRLLENEELLKLVATGKAAKPLDLPNVYHKGERSPSVIHYLDDRGDAIVGLSNWSAAEELELSVALGDLGLDPNGNYALTELYSGRKLGKAKGEFRYTLPPKGAAIVKVERGGGQGHKDDTPPANLALGKPATASSTWSGAGYEASKLTDGDWRTRWSAADGAKDDQWVEVDFGAETAVNRVVVKEHKGDYFQTANWALQYWDAERQQFVDLTKGFTLGDDKVIDFDAVRTTKLRLSLRSNYILPSIEEVEAYYIEGNGGPTLVQDNSNAPYASYSDIRAQVQRMQVFTLKHSDLPKLDVYIYESYVNAVPADAYFFDIVTLDANDEPLDTLFTASLPAYNIPGTVSPYSIYPRLKNLDTNLRYGLVLKSPKSADTGSTDNQYGFAYNDDDSYADGYERLSSDGGNTWITENGGRRDLVFSLYSEQ
ncbi:discoidin domain-containing protein [Paenibacillus sp.]|uniref:discoidin domain-containing protein n=1 Tax=Paenibacillus sp. TaxID=58172 RepID=UPI0028112C33|nr:discoidin domain-containing protein [Paenibacillus sp.]